MKRLRWLWTSAWVGAVLASHAGAQDYVRAVSPAGFYDDQEQIEPSPSDLVAPEVNALRETKEGVKTGTKTGTGGVCWTHDWQDAKGVGKNSGNDAWKLFPENSLGIDIGGWTQIGYHSRASVNDADLFNIHPDRVHVHQQWLYAERVADGTYGMDWGFRFDAMYGIDAENTQAFGNPGGRWDNSDAFRRGIYGWALPQAYAEAAVGDLSVIAGKFYTTIGYEGVMAPDNFFYSHAYTMNNSEPFTHTGFLATYDATERTTLYGGWTLGWDTGFDRFERGSNFLGGFSVELTDDIEMTYMTTIGDFGWIGRDGYMQSLVFDVALTHRLNYVFQSDYLYVGDARDDDGALTVGLYETIGINQYLIYTLNDCWGFGGRLEWWRDAGLSHNQAAFGVNYRPHSNVVFRPEVRQEWVPGDDLDQIVFGMDAVITY